MSKNLLKKGSIQQGLMKTLDSIKTYAGHETYLVKTLGRKIAIVSIIKPKKGGSKSESELGLQLGDLVFIDASKEEYYAIYVGKGLDPDCPNNKEGEHWFLAENDLGIHYYGNLLSKSDLAEIGIRKINYLPEEE